MGVSLKNSIKFFAIFCFIASSVIKAPSVSGQAAFITPQRGMSYATWERDRFASEYSDASLKQLTHIGVEYVAAIVTWYQEEHTSTEIKKTDRSPSIESTEHLISQAHALGLNVMLKPHVDLIDKFDGTFWRADIGFYNDADWKEWFENYTDYILTYAKIAEEKSVKIFCVGTELSFTTQKPDKWRELISRVREVYSGKLVYAANWDNYQNVEFWDELDFIGIDAYFPLTNGDSPTLDQIKQGWRRWSSEIETWLGDREQKVIFTEIGYASTSSAARRPWQGGLRGNADPEIQKKCYEAFFQTIWNEPWLAGAYWWKWNTHKQAGGIHNRQFTPQNKPALEVLKRSYNSVAR